MDQMRPLLEDDDVLYHTPGTQRRNRIIIALLALYSMLVSVALIGALLLKIPPTKGDSLPLPPCKSSNYLVNPRTQIISRCQFRSN